MRVLTVRAARAHLAKVLEAVCTDHEPTIIVRRRGAPVVLMSLADYESMQASLHSPCSEERGSFAGLRRRISEG